VDVYCREHSLDRKARCRLFLLICEAVAYAHRNLVVHRDLKPGNIFVTDNGTPRLLDFGVAKLLTADADSGLPATMAVRPITPEYSSPEQVRGFPVNTATDVYSLGAILYELLTGSRAQPIATHTPLEIERVVCESEVRRPSLLAPGLDADLDTIVAMALRKEPERRYPSVDRLADDLRRHLDGRPVLARQDSWGYRARKFVRRHRAALAVGVLFAAVLIAAACVSALQARRATREQVLAEHERRLAMESEARATSSRTEAEWQAREADRQRAVAVAQSRQAELQRIAAETQRQVADRRFQQVRQLAGKFLLEFHDSIAKLPGSIAARKMVVETGLQYYDSLVKDAHGNPDLLQEIARGYDRLGDVQGNPYYANLGDSAGAVASYQKAFAIRQSLTDPSAEFLSDRIGGNIKFGQVLGIRGDLKGADQKLREAISLGEQAPSRQNYAVRTALAGAYRGYGDLQFRSGAYAKALEPYSRMLELWTGLQRENREPAAEQAGISLGHAKLGDALARLHRNEESLAHLRIAIAIDRQMVAADRNNIPRLRQLFADYSILCLVFGSNESLAAPGEARETSETAAQLAGQLAAADPNNNIALFDVMTAETLVGDWFRKHDDPPAAVPHYRKAVDAVEKFAANGPSALFTWEALTFAHQRLASGLGRSGELEESLEQCRKAEEYADRAEKQNPGLLETAARRAYIANTRAQAYSHRQLWREAIAAYTAADLILDDLHHRDPRNQTYLSDQIQTRRELADCYAATELWTGAVRALEAALDRLTEVASLRPLLPEEEQQRTAAVAQVAIWKQK
jgi:tetratricopeptide (TPR) repeat protein